MPLLQSLRQLTIRSLGIPEQPVDHSDLGDLEAKLDHWAANTTSLAHAVDGLINVIEEMGQRLEALEQRIEDQPEQQTPDLDQGTIAELITEAMTLGQVQNKLDHMARKAMRDAITMLRLTTPD